MIIALMALAFAMIVGGLLAAFFGWDIVLIERGWTMVIAGSISAASGALLLGVTAVVSKLTQIQAELARLQLSLDEEAAVEAPVGPTGMSMAALSGGLLAGTMFGRGEAKGSDDDKTTDPVIESVSTPEAPAPSRTSEPFMPFPPRTPPNLSTSDEEDVTEVKVPDFLLGDRSHPTNPETGAPDVDQKLFGEEVENPVEEDRIEEGRFDMLETTSETIVVTEQERLPEPEPEPVEVIAVSERSTSDEPAEPTPTEEEPAPAEPRPPTIIGTYNSGDNTYVMFSDGSIEAQTPSGVFQFQSLDELKAFIAAGGGGGESGSI